MFASKDVSLCCASRKLVQLLVLFLGFFALVAVAGCSSGAVVGC